jgi:hypothetical protein
VLRLRTMASLARDAGMFTFALLFEYFAVANFAGLMTRMGDRERGDLGDRIAAVMAKLSKAAWDHESSHAYKYERRQKEHGRHAKQVFYILHAFAKRNLKPSATFATSLFFNAKQPLRTRQCE